MSPHTQRADLARQHERTARQSTLRLLALFALVVVGLLAAVNAVLALIYRITFPFASQSSTCVPRSAASDESSGSVARASSSAR